jgi:hypothetical protein
MKFVQLYSSPVFEDFRQLLVRPDNAGDIHGVTQVGAMRKSTDSRLW